MTARKNMSAAKKSEPKPSGGPVPTRLRQIALVVKDLERAKHQLVRTATAEIQFITMYTEQD